MINAKCKAQNHSPSPTFSVPRWTANSFHDLPVFIIACLQQLIARALAAIRELHALLANHVPLSSLFDFIKLSLVASEIYPWSGNFAKPQPTSFYLTDDELETCLDYSSLSSKPSSDKWLDLDTVNPFDQSSYEKRSMILSKNYSSSNLATETDNNSYEIRSFSENTPVDNNVRSIEHLLTPSAPASPSSTTLLQPKLVPTRKKGQTKSNMISVDSNVKSTPLKKSSNVLTPSGISFQVSNPSSPKSPAKKIGHKSVKSEPLNSTFKSSTLQNKRGLSSVSQNSTLELPSRPDSYAKRETCQDPDSSTKNSKKQRQIKALNKKMPVEGAPTGPACLSTSFKKVRNKGNDLSLEEKGFKLVSKKTKRKKNSVDRASDGSAVTAASHGTQFKKTLVPAACLNDQGLLGRERLVKSEAGILAEIMDTALLNIHQLSDNDNDSDVLPCYSSSPVSSCASPSPNKWSSDGRFFGHSHSVSSPVFGLDNNSSLSPSSLSSWTMKPPQIDFSNNQPPLQPESQSQPQRFSFPFQLEAQSRSFPFSPPQQAFDNGSGVLRPYFTTPPLSSFPNHPPLFSSISPPLSPSVTDLKSPFQSLQRRNTRVTNSTLAWSVPAHMSNV